MNQQAESHAGAVALVVPSVVPVQLRLSAVDRLWAVARWLLWLVGLVVVLWFGSAFLSASPASAAVPVTAASPGLLKGGNSKSAGGKNGDTPTASTTSAADKKKPADDKKADDKKKPADTDKKKEVDADD